MEKERSSFSGKLGFVLATAGSAVGLGNIWRFPYLAARYGGGIFLLVYIILAVTFGYTLMTAEIALGRKTGVSAIEAFSKLNEKYAFIGIMAALVPIIIFPYYSVIGGWVVKYFVAFLTGHAAETASETYFSGFISQVGQPILWLFIFMIFTSTVVFFGVEKGIEKISKIVMPILILLSIIICIYVIFLPGSIEGIKYYFLPDFSSFSTTTVWAALGQLFYSMSLAMGIMITYGSYMKKDIDLEKSVTQIEIFDTGIAIISGFMIVPAVVVFSGGNKAALDAGPGLMFVTLPKVFETMNLGGAIGTLFFLLVLVAALTSSISLMETIVSIFRDKFGWDRKFTCIFVFMISILMALPSTLGYSVLSNVLILGMDFLDFFDFISNRVLMPIVAFATCIFIGYIIKPKVIIDEIKISSEFKREKLFTFMLKYISPILLLIILVSYVMDSFGIINI